MSVTTESVTLENLQLNDEIRYRNRWVRIARLSPTRHAGEPDASRVVQIVTLNGKNAGGTITVMMHDREVIARKHHADEHSRAVALIGPAADVEGWPLVYYPRRQGDRRPWIRPTTDGTTSIRYSNAEVALRPCVAESDADAVLRAVETRFSSWMSAEVPPEDRPRLVRDYQNAPWAVVWEMGPDWWATNFADGYVDAETYQLGLEAGLPAEQAQKAATVHRMTLPENVRCEAYCPFVISIYAND